ncbi:esterase [Agrococcus sediminis]|uniref:Esterase n=1 Tax=Agrococcus sediminis TaxID=2599924 RepID=A0A5M8Q7N6_9MICO|nr:esterase [Agrococcus sediminis]KAA6430876.1 esterase [Agrococcus sediminis]
MAPAADGILDSPSEDAAPRLAVVAGDPDRRPWLLLHGTDGSEADLVPLAHRLAPGAGTIAVRGAVRTTGGFAHFRRRPDRTIDEDDLLARAETLSALVSDAVTAHGFRREPIVLGYSNGAIMAAAIIALRPELLGAAILLRPLAPFGSGELPRVPGLPVLLVEAADDARRRPDDAERVSRRLGDAGADVVHRRLRTGHALAEDDRIAIAAWLLARPSLDR